MNQSQNA
jgi:hypothetical protein